jgi:hypothetical protein
MINNEPNLIVHRRRHHVTVFNDASRLHTGLWTGKGVEGNNSGPYTIHTCLITRF